MKNILVIMLMFIAVAAFAETPAYKICPVCGKVYQLEFKFCPIDGAELVQIGGYEKEEPKTEAKKTPASIETPPVESISATPQKKDKKESPEYKRKTAPYPTSTPVKIKTESGEKLIYPSDFSEDTMKGCSDEMIYIPAGSFNMGSKTFPYPTDAKMVHSVYLDSYCIDKYEYPNKLYSKPASKGNY